MLKTSKWYNPDWPDYFCTECGELFQLYINGKCIKCRSKETISIPERIKAVRKEKKLKPKPITKKKNGRTKL